MGFCAYDCGDEEHTCTAWDGKGTITHNLQPECPADIAHCPWRRVFFHAAIFELIEGGVPAGRTATKKGKRTGRSL